VKEHTALPVFTTMTFGEDGRTFLGTDPAAAAITLTALGADAVGINCSLGPEALRPALREMIAATHLPVMIQPNAGLPRLVEGKTVFDVEPEEFARCGALFLDDGAVSRGLIGSVEIPAEMMRGYKKGVLIVDPEASQIGHSGGLAAKAGEASAKVTIETKERVTAVNEAATQAASDAIEVTTTGIGKGIKRIKNSVKGAVDGYREESGANERAAAKKAAASTAKKTASSGTAKKTTSSASGASSGTAKKTTTTAKKTTTTAKKSSSSSSSSTGKAVSDHMKGVGSMFSDFKKEFDKAKK